jgi:hypothetical protein
MCLSGGVALAWLVGGKGERWLGGSYIRGSM